MGAETAIREAATERVLLGDEAVALGAMHAGLRAAYAYPGTPSTEILEFLLGAGQGDDAPLASWAVNEKTAYEQALGVSMAGGRALVAMKHVGVNVAADPFVNSALVSIRGGLVLAVGDDPGMHSSQNEQDTRCYADLARVPCLEPADQQQAYDMARDAFELSERFQVPVVLRLVTRLAHSRAPIRVRRPVDLAAGKRPSDAGQWVLLPAFARRQWKALLSRQPEMRAWSETCRWNVLRPGDGRTDIAVITTGIGRNYYLENLPDLGPAPDHLHIGAYPFPASKIRDLAARIERLIVIEEGYPYLERYLRGILPQRLEISGKEDGTLPPDGELTPDRVRTALGLSLPPEMPDPELVLPPRPPRLCDGCPHTEAYIALKQALAAHEHPVVTSDIGCYTLGILPPHSIGESCVCMGASIGMAKGAADAGVRPVVAVIGDSTFLHSGLTPLIDAAAADSDMTVLILDNQAVAMTGAQPTVLPPSRLEPVVRGLGVDPAHCHVVRSHPKQVEAMTDLLRAEINHRGLSVVIAARECLERVRRRRNAEEAQK